MPEPTPYEIHYRASVGMGRGKAIRIHALKKEGPAYLLGAAPVFEDARTIAQGSMTSRMPPFKTYEGTPAFRAQWEARVLELKTVKGSSVPLVSTAKPKLVLLWKSPKISMEQVQEALCRFIIGWMQHECPDTLTLQPSGTSVPMPKRLIKKLKVKNAAERLVPPGSL